MNYMGCATKLKIWQHQLRRSKIFWMKNWNPYWIYENCGENLKFAFNWLKKSLKSQMRYKKININFIVEPILIWIVNILDYFICLGSQDERYYLDWLVLLLKFVIDFSDVFSTDFVRDTAEILKSMWNHWINSILLKWF